MFFKRVPAVEWSDLKPTDVIIDVREPFEFKQHHVPKAKNIPLGKVGDFTTENKVFVVCASGSRSKRAVKILRKKGIDAVNINGGMMRYGK